MTGTRRPGGRFQALFEVSPLATVQYGPDGTVELWNPAAERLFGWSAEEARGRRLPEGPAGETRVAEIADALRRGEALRQVATVLCHRDGTPRAVELSSAPLHDEDDHLVGVLVVHTEPASPGAGRLAWR
jgi:PAS domain S-box-containing protein